MSARLRIGLHATLALCLLLVSGPALANEICWDNGSTDFSSGDGIDDTNPSPDGLWTTPANWRTNNNSPHTPPNDDVAPGPGDRANIGFTTTTSGWPATIQAADNITVSAVRVGVNPGLGVGGHGLLDINGGTLNIVDTGTGDGFIVGHASRYGTVNLSNGGTVSVDKQLIIADTSSTGTSVFQIDGAASSLTVTGATEISKAATGQLVVNDGTVNLNGGLTLQNANARLFANGGTVTVTGGLSYGNDSARLEVNAGSVVNVDAITSTALGQLHLNGGTFNLTASDINVQSVRIGNLPGTTGTYAIGAGESITTEGDLAVGDEGTGTLTVDGGATVSTRVLFVGLAGSATGTLNLLEGTLTATSGVEIGGTSQTETGTAGTVTVGKVGGADADAVLTSSGANFEVGQGGTGSLTQQSGTVNVNSSNLVLAQGVDSVGNYTIHDGILNTVAQLNMNRGTAVFTQNGGAVTIGTDVQMATNVAAAVATYNMNGGTLDIGGVLDIADRGTATFNQNGGATTVSGNLRFTDNGTDSDGTLNLNDGTLTVVTGSSIITDAGTGTINLNKTGVLNVVDGNIKATNLNVGVTASAAYTQTAGLVDVNKLTLGNGAFAGTYNVDGGTLKANHIAAGSPSTLNVGTNGSAGTLQVTGNINPALSQSSRLTDLNIGGDGTLMVTLGAFGPQLLATDADFAGGSFDVDLSEVVATTSTGTGKQTTWIAGTAAWAAGSHAEWDRGSPEGWTVAPGGAVTVVNSTNASTGAGLTAIGQAATDGWTFDNTTDPNNAQIISASGITSGPVRAVIDAPGDTITRNDPVRIANEAGASAALLQLKDGSLVFNTELVIGGDADGTVTHNGGTVTLNGGLRFGPTAASTQGGTYDLNAGTLVVNGNIVESASSVDSAQLQINGGALQITGSILVQRFSVGEVGAGAYTHDNGQPLTTTGTLSCGDRAPGTFIIDGTPVTASNMTVGDDDGSAGSVLTVQGGGSLTVNGQTDIGDALTAEGTIAILGGSTWTNNGRIVLGGQDTAAGTLNLVNGTVNQTSAELYLGGDDGSADRMDTSGTVVVGQSGETDHSLAVLNASAGNLEVGRGGTGVFTQHSGTVNVTGANLVLAQYDNAVGTYNMNGGALNLTSDLNMNRGVSDFNHNGGTVTVGTNLNLALSTSQSSATYNLAGGTLDLTGGNVDLRTAGAHFTFTGGTLRNVANFGSANLPVTDDSGNENGGTLAASMANDDLVAGKIANAIDFDGANDYVNFGDVAVMDTAGVFSAAMWLNRRTDNAGGALDTNHGTNNVLLAQSSVAANDNFEVGTEGSNIEVYMDCGGTSGFDGLLAADTSGAGGIADNTWHHLAVVYDKNDTDADGNTLDVYFNGAHLQGFSQPVGNLDNSGSSPLTLGIARPTDEAWGDFDGQIDEFALWTRVLTATEVTDLYNGGIGSPASTIDQTDLQIYTPLDALPDMSLIQQGGTIAPGASAGTTAIWGNYGLEAAGVYAVELGGFGIGEYDLIEVADLAALAGALDLAMIDGFYPDPFSTYDVLTADSIEDLGITITGQHSGMFTYEIVDIAGGRQALRLTSHVPEPATLTMLALGGLALLIRRRRS